MDIQTCPRRMMEFGPWEHEEGLDSWMESPRREGELTPFCSFCGSLHPGKFLELVGAGWCIEPTDKTYKAYLNQVFAGVETHAEPGRPLPVLEQHTRSKFYYQHLTSEQQRQFIALYNEGRMRLAQPGHFYVLPFFMRLASQVPEGS